MRFLQRITHDLKAGWVRLRFGTVRAANRALEETELLKMRLEIRKLDRRMKELCRDIGDRAIELHERDGSSSHVLSDREIVSLVGQVTSFQSERDKLMAEIKDVQDGN